MLTKLHLDTVTFPEYSNEGTIPDLEFSKLNIFIGPNNSGKSRFLRKLFHSNFLYFQLNTSNTTQFNDLVSNYITNIEPYIDKQFKDIILNKILVALELKDHSTFNMKYKTTLLDKTSRLIQNAYYLNSNPNPISNGGYYVTKFLPFTQSLYENISALPELDSINFQNNRVYIPILRGLRNIDNINYQSPPGNNNYLDRTIKDYFKNDVSSKNEMKISTGLEFYTEIRSHLLGYADKRAFIRSFEAFLSKNFFENQDLNIVPHEDDDVLYLKIGKQKDFPIYDLGDGLQTLIIIIYNLLKYKDTESYLFLEEPDLLLHPGYQRQLINILQYPEFERIQVFLTTHSNHLLDLTNEFNSTAVFRFTQSKDNNFLITSTSISDRKSLEVLGVNFSSVMIANCTIWVEGITDRIYIRKIIEILLNENKQKFKEDIHYSFVEYSGNNITHWSFLENEDNLNPNINTDRIFSTIFLISDHDKPLEGSKKEKRQQSLKSKLNDRYYKLESLEIENTLKPEIIKMTISTLEGSSIEFKSSIGDYKNIKLGTFIEENVSVKRKYSSNSGSIRNKLEFAKTATKYMKSNADLSTEQIRLGGQIISFIKSCNL